MKKILGISLVAALAVSPMMANAAAGTKAVAATPLQTDAVATANYVTGAYNAVVDDLTVASGTHYNIDASDTTGENLVNLDAAIGDIADGDVEVSTGVKMIQANGSVADNLGRIDTKVGALETAIGGINTDLEDYAKKSGVEKTVKEAINNSTISISLINTWGNTSGTATDYQVVAPTTVNYSEPTE